MPYSTVNPCKHDSFNTPSRVIKIHIRQHVSNKMPCQQFYKTKKSWGLIIATINNKI